jgi:heme oxygenase
VFPLRQSAATTTPVRPAPRESSGSWLHWLGASTVQHHAVADRARLAVLDAASLPAYRAYLERIYGFESAVELQASTVRGLEIALHGARRRLALLRQDLATLGLDDLETSPIPRPRITIATASDALGWLFVIERHVLLAGLIRRVIVSERPAFANATRYFATHIDGGARFRELGDAIRT